MPYTKYLGRRPQKGEQQTNPHGSAEYAAWCNMHTRCRNPRFKQWHNYGGRGIQVCVAWHSYANFLRSMGRMPAPGYTLDRESADQNYQPNNCRWLPRHKNVNRGRLFYSAFGLKKRLTEWLGDSRCVIRDRGLLYQRLRLGWTLHRALTQPKENHTKKGRVFQSASSL